MYESHNVKLSNDDLNKMIECAVENHGITGVHRRLALNVVSYHMQ